MTAARIKRIRRGRILRKNNATVTPLSRRIRRIIAMPAITPNVRVIMRALNGCPIDYFVSIRRKLSSGKRWCASLSTGRYLKNKNWWHCVDPYIITIIQQFRFCYISFVSDNLP